MAVWDIKSWCWQPGFPMGQHYDIALRMHCDKLVPVKNLLLLPGHKPPITNVLFDFHLDH